MTILHILTGGIKGAGSEGARGTFQPSNSLPADATCYRPTKLMLRLQSVHDGLAYAACALGSSLPKKGFDGIVIHTDDTKVFGILCQGRTAKNVSTMVYGIQGVVDTLKSLTHAEVTFHKDKRNGRTAQADPFGLTDFDFRIETT